MAVFIDAGVFIALRNADDENHERSVELMKRALKGEFGLLYTSDYIFDECVTTALVRTKRHDLAVDVGEYVLKSPRITKFSITKDDFNEAWVKFQKLKDRPISFTDCTTLVLMDKHNIRQIMSFDTGFNGLTKRISWLSTHP